MAFEAGHREQHQPRCECMCRQAQAHADVLQGKQPAAAPAGSPRPAVADGLQMGKDCSPAKRPGKALSAFWSASSTGHLVLTCNYDERASEQSANDLMLDKRSAARHEEAKDVSISQEESQDQSCVLLWCRFHAATTLPRPEESQRPRSVRDTRASCSSCAKHSYAAQLEVICVGSSLKLMQPCSLSLL